MLRMRLAVDGERVGDVVRALEGERGVTSVARHANAVTATGEDEVTAWVREGAVDEVLAALRALGVV
jgi:Arc/MetJ family transcription regulator